jgi:hypothetical protein
MNEINVIITSLEKIFAKTDTRNDWEDMLSIQFKDKRAEALRQLLWQVSEAFPGQSPVIYSGEGMDVLKAILEALKKEQNKIPRNDRS